MLACVADTCLDADSGAGFSAVNTNILAAFIAAQTAAEASTPDCAALRDHTTTPHLMSMSRDVSDILVAGTVTQIEVIVPQMFVPVMQGLYREAWEVDEAMIDVHYGADGFVEVVEGWAFAMAVL